MLRLRKAPVKFLVIERGRIDAAWLEFDRRRAETQVSSCDEARRSGTVAIRKKVPGLRFDCVSVDHYVTAEGDGQCLKNEGWCT
jgi:hypothetical protein